MQDIRIHVYWELKEFCREIWGSLRYLCRICGLLCVVPFCLLITTFYWIRWGLDWMIVGNIHSQWYIMNLLYVFLIKSFSATKCAGCAWELLHEVLWGVELKWIKLFRVIGQQLVSHVSGTHRFWGKCEIAFWKMKCVSSLILSLVRA